MVSRTLRMYVSALSVCFVGCTHVQLRNNTIN
jgi:hypothetical protein